MKFFATAKGGIVAITTTYQALTTKSSKPPDWPSAPEQTGTEEAYWPNAVEANATASVTKSSPSLDWPPAPEQTGIEEAYCPLVTTTSGDANQVLCDGGDDGAFGAQVHTTPHGGDGEAVPEARHDAGQVPHDGGECQDGTDLSGSSIVVPRSNDRWCRRESFTMGARVKDERRGGALGEHDTRFADPNSPLKSGGWYRSSIVVLKDERRGGTLGEYDTRFADPPLKSNGLNRSVIEPLVMGANATVGLTLFHREKQRAFRDGEGTNGGIPVVRSEAVT